MFYLSTIKDFDPVKHLFGYFLLPSLDQFLHSAPACMGAQITQILDLDGSHFSKNSPYNFSTPCLWEGVCELYLIRVEKKRGQPNNK